MMVSDFLRGIWIASPPKKSKNVFTPSDSHVAFVRKKPELVVTRRVFVLNMEVVVPSFAHVVEFAICKKTSVAFDELVLVLIESSQPQTVIQKEIGAWFPCAVVRTDRFRPKVLIELIDD